MGLFKKQKHTHKWSYMFSSSDNEHQWYYCTECLAQCTTELDPANNKVKAPTIFETEKPIPPMPKKKKGIFG
jgi:hypothetical protein